MAKLTRNMALALLGVAVAGAVGCTTTSSVEAAVTPTHQWVAELDVSRAKYNFDNHSCAEAADVDVDPGDGALEKSTPAFVAYERCMEAKGYRLSTYSPTRYPGGTF